MTVKTLSNKHLVLAGVVIIAFVFVTAVRIRPYCLDIFVRSFSRIHYFEDSDTTDAILSSLLILFFFSSNSILEQRI